MNTSFTSLSKQNLVVNQSVEPATKRQREYLVNVLLPKKNISYQRLLEMVSKLFGGRKIKDIAEIRFSSQMSMIINYVSKLPDEEYKWNQR